MHAEQELKFFREFTRHGRTPDDPLHPFYYHVFRHTLPPEAAYRAVPKTTDIVAEDMKWVKKKGRNRRLIFGGWGNYTEFEKEQIEKFN